MSQFLSRSLESEHRLIGFAQNPARLHQPLPVIDLFGDGDALVKHRQGSPEVASRCPALTLDSQHERLPRAPADFSGYGQRAFHGADCLRNARIPDQRREFENGCGEPRQDQDASQALPIVECGEQVCGTPCDVLRPEKITVEVARHGDEVEGLGNASLMPQLLEENECFVMAA